MLENPLVPNLLLHSQRRSTTKTTDMTLDDSPNLLLVKNSHINKQRQTISGDLPLKKRYQKTEQPTDNFTDKKNDDSTTLALSYEAPVDFSLPNRVRAKSIADDNVKRNKNQVNKNYCEFRESTDNDADKTMALLADQANAAAIFNFNASLLQFSNLWRSPLFLNNLSPFPSNNIPLITPIARHSRPETVEKTTTTDNTTSLQRYHYQPVVKKPKLSLISSISSSTNFDDDCEDLDVVSLDPSVSTYVINPATGNRVRRCYKNMTTERRMEANARERTRVHTIGAAFDRLRKLIPSLGADQKLSKLSILRISCAYIMLLASMNDLDYSAEGQAYSVEECTEMLTETVNSEVKFKR